MANSTEEQTEKLPISKESDVAEVSVQSDDFNYDTPVETEIKPDYPGSGRNEEVPALLGVSKVIESRESDIIVTPISTENNPEEKIEAAESKNIVPAPEEYRDEHTELRTIQATTPGQEVCEREFAGLRTDLSVVQEGLRDSIAHCQYISSKVDAVSNDTDNLLQQVKAISVNSELLAAELELISSGDNTKKTLSKSFLMISSTIVALLAIFQVYIFISLIKTERIQAVTGSAVMRNISGLNKKMAAYDHNLTKAMENQPKQEHAQPTSPVAEKTHDNREAAPVTSVHEKMNKLRNGLLEKKLIRKETGDWFVYNKKNDECISDIEVIEVLNQAYRKIGRSISSEVPMPSHNALCILKPDGKGGTEVVMTKTFVP